MLTSDWQRDICADYRDGGCANRPFLLDRKKGMCKGNCHYNSNDKKWVKDDGNNNRMHTPGNVQGLYKD